MKTRLIQNLSGRGWWLVLPTAMILAVVLGLTYTAQAAPSPTAPRVLLNELLFQEQQPLCQNCHPEQYTAWQGTTHARAAMDPAFQEQLKQAHNPTACLACHTTGFDIDTGAFLAEGVTCEACHGPYKEGHPKAETMQLPMESDTCRLCHLNTFTQWENSPHAARKIDCFDCHQAHTQGLRLETPEKLCAACHTDEQTRLAHSIHGIAGVDCMSCHMAPQQQPMASTEGATRSISNHSFLVASDVCIRCHTSSAHPEENTNRVAIITGTGAASSRELELQARRVQELEQQVNDAQAQVRNLRNLAVVSMGLMLGVGGMIGLLIGVGLATLVNRRKGS